ncbi:hypothetical protein B0H13DRAFT_1873208 [Mycena leptocephala]|nr:hypothetical protein B0H13DRAFT_1873208 [Mycena leptocephala]
MPYHRLLDPYTHASILEVREDLWKKILGGAALCLSTTAIIQPPLRQCAACSPSARARAVLKHWVLNVRARTGKEDNSSATAVTELLFFAPECKGLTSADWKKTILILWSALAPNPLSGTYSLRNVLNIWGRKEGRISGEETGMRGATRSSAKAWLLQRAVLGVRMRPRWITAGPMWHSWPLEQGLAYNRPNRRIQERIIQKAFIAKSFMARLE